MARVHFSPEFAQTLENVEQVIVEVEDGRTVRDALAEAARRAGPRFEDAVLDGRGEGARLALDVGVWLGERRVEDADERVPAGAELLVAPLKGNAGPLDNV